MELKDKLIERLGNQSPNQWSRGENSGQSFGPSDARSDSNSTWYKTNLDGFDIMLVEHNKVAYEKRGQEGTHSQEYHLSVYEGRKTVVRFHDNATLKKLFSYIDRTTSGTALQRLEVTVAV